MKAALLIRKLLGVSVMTKTRTGFLIALVGVITIAGDVTSSSIGFLSRNDTYVFIGMGVLGFVGRLMGRAGEVRPTETTADQIVVEGEVTAEHPLAFLRSLKCWGLILVLAASILSCLAIWRQPKPVFVARARPLPLVVTLTLTNIFTITNEAP
jgi:hypothetical protein